MMDTFTVISKDNKKIQVEAFLNDIFPEELNYDNIEIENELFSCIDSRRFLLKVMEHMNDTFTIVTEEFHIDKTFRDSYYMYFSNQHFQIDRYCKRLSFFVGEINWHSLLNANEKFLKLLSDNFIGMCVIKPICNIIIGRALFNPMYFLKKGSSYLRLSKYNLNIYGVRLSIDAFPYQMQDKETTRCAEVTLLNMLDYYSNTYKEYKSVLPSDIIASEQKHCHERVLPSRGVTYHVLTKILTDFGFSPRLYNIMAMHKDNLSGITQKDELKRLLHYYIESGIPVAINVEPINKSGAGHSLLCIGHSSKKSDKNAELKKKLIGNGFESKIGIINSADFYDEYVIIDDNQFPYEIRSFDKISLYSDMPVTNLSVPLYKRMFLEAADAYDIAHMILESEKFGVLAGSRNYLKQNDDIVIRLFLASSRSFKNFRVAEMDNKNLALKVYYAKLRMPQFIWVCELYTRDGYKRNKIFGEIVIDATSASKTGIKNIIMINYPSGIYARNPNQIQYDMVKNLYVVDEWQELNGYSRNLYPI